MSKDFDVIVWGATGFTGKLVVEYLAKTYGVRGDLKWAIAGRDQRKLEQVRKDCVAESERQHLAVFTADSHDARSLSGLTSRAKVICTTVGPYATHGTTLVEACVATGTHYCDLAGEVQWMARVIPRLQAQAEETGAKIVHTCGFDSIPSDMGTWYVQRAMLEQHGVAGNKVSARVGKSKGAASGGTIASMFEMLEESKRDSNVKRALSDPYSLYPEGVAKGQDKRDQTSAIYDDNFQQWTCPFIMSAINARVVRRSNAISGFPWGEDFRYDESQLCSNRGKALAATVAMGMGMVTVAFGPGRKLAQRLLPAPGEGPNRAAREAGFYELFFHASHPEDSSKDLRAKVTGDMDPGYGSTSKMLAESAICLAMDDLDTGGGFWTPSTALGESLLDRLTGKAGLTFELIPIT
ncbi:MAG: saccharopine dehydrogenase NADP-binding domain-containing protein [Halioglobus sp.]